MVADILQRLFRLLPMAAAPVQRPLQALGMVIATLQRPFRRVGGGRWKALHQSLRAFQLQHLLGYGGPDFAHEVFQQRKTGRTHNTRSNHAKLPAEQTDEQSDGDKREGLADVVAGTPKP